MRRCYTFCLYLLAPLIVLRLLFKSRKNVAYRDRIFERFELFNSKKLVVDVWVHAVSFGEVVAATPLIEELLRDNQKVLVTSMTPSGSKQILAQFSTRVMHQYLPYDLPWCLKRFFKKINVKVGIIMETELWPNLIYYAKSSGVKLGLINARISDKAIKQYQKTGKLFKPILNNFTFIGAQSELDAKRFIGLGANPEIVSVLGNIKFDLAYRGASLKDFSSFKVAWGQHRPVLIAASTHENEEQLLLAKLSILKKAIPGIILLIAPRHMERFKSVYDLCNQLAFKTALRSKYCEINEDTDIVILDSMGEMLSFFKLSDVAFIGGSLVPIGGHNVLEPIIMGVPVFCGPYMQNSKSICEELKANDAIGWTKDTDDLIVNIIAIFKNPQKILSQVTNASAVLKANQGALMRYFAKIKFMALNN